MTGPALTWDEEMQVTRTYLQSLRIRDKLDQLVPFDLNFVQRRVLDRKAELRKMGRRPRYVILKARRMGITTLEQGLNFFEVAFKSNKEVLTLAHDNLHTEKIFRISNLFYEHLPEPKPLRLTSHNKRELNLPLKNSLFSISTAGSRAPSRGETLSRAHWSEVAWSPGSAEDQRNLLVGITEAASHGSVTLESTPNGVGNLFHQVCMDAMKGTGGWSLIFIPWYEDPSYAIPLSHEQEEEMRPTLTDEEKMLVEKAHLTLSQIAWRRAKIADLTVGGDARLFPQEYPEDVETCFLVSGLNFFDLGKLQALVKAGFPDPVEVREIPGDRAGTGGRTTVWKVPQKGHRYVVGCDTAGGGPEGNESVAGVLEVASCEQVATLRGRWKPDVFGRLVAKLATTYNHALLAVEMNNHGHSVLNTLVNECSYSNLYHAIAYADGDRKQDPGWLTDGRTRPVMLNDLRAATEERWMKVNDPVYVSQAMTFKLDRDEEKYKAAPGCNDDTVMAWAVAVQARKDPDVKPVTVGTPAGKIALDRNFGALHKTFGWSDRRHF